MDITWVDYHITHRCNLLADRRTSRPCIAGLRSRTIHSTIKNQITMEPLKKKWSMCHPRPHYLLAGVVDARIADDRRERLNGTFLPPPCEGVPMDTEEARGLGLGVPPLGFGTGWSCGQHSDLLFTVTSHVRLGLCRRSEKMLSPTPSELIS